MNEVVAREISVEDSQERGGPAREARPLQGRETGARRSKLLQAGRLRAEVGRRSWLV
jgi:hypothetical protein